MEIILGILALVLLWAYNTYVKLIKQRNKVLETVSSVDVYLQQRADVLPNMLKVAKKFMQHEDKLLQDIVKLRNAATTPYNKLDSDSLSKHMADVQKFDMAMEKFQMQVEAYPDLKSDQLMLKAQNSIESVEADLQAARRFYNSEVNSLKNKVEIFPSSAIASLINVKCPPFYEVSKNTRKSINVEDYL